MDGRMGLVLVALVVVVSAATAAVAAAHGDKWTCRRDVSRCELALDAWGRPVGTLASIIAGFAPALLGWRAGGPRLLAATAAAVAVLVGALAATVAWRYGPALLCEKRSGGTRIRTWHPWAPPLLAAGLVVAAAGVAVGAMAMRQNLISS